MWFKEMKNDISDIIKLYPSLSILVSLLSGIGLFLFNQTIFVYIIFCFLFVLFSFSQKNNRIKIIIFFIISLTVTYFSINYSKSHYYNTAPRSNYGGKIKVVIDDYRCTSRNVQFLSNPKVLKGNLLEIYNKQNKLWEKASGKVAIKFPKEIEKIQYSDTYILDGAFLEMSSPVIKGFDYGKYLEQKNIEKVFDVVSFRKIKTLPNIKMSLMRKIMNFRDLSLNALTQNFSKISTKRIIAGLFYGLKHNISFDSKNIFIRSGIIHLFVVSGLHVGLLAILIFLFLSFCSYKKRYIATIFCLLFYVIMTGMQVSATRAFIMVSIWCLHKAFLRYTPTLNIVFFAASAILLYEPKSIYHLGFQYSFIITFFLILTSERFFDWLKLYHIHNKYLPIGHLKQYTFFKWSIEGNIFLAVTTSFIAFYAGSYLSLFYQGYINPYSPFINLLFMPIIWVIFILSPFCFVPFVSKISSFLIEELISFMNLLSAQVASFSISIGKPHIVLIIIFYCLLFSIFIIRDKKKFWIVFSLILAIIIYPFFRSQDNLEIYIFHGGTSKEPSFVIIYPNETKATVINISSKEIGINMTNLLANKGINVIDKVIITKANKPFFSGIFYLSSFDIKQIIVNQNNKRNSLLYYVNKILENNPQILVYAKENKYLDSSCKLLFSKSKYTLYLKKNFISITTIEENSGRFIKIVINDKVVLNKKILPTNKLKVLSTRGTDFIMRPF